MTCAGSRQCNSANKAMAQLECFAAACRCFTAHGGVLLPCSKWLVRPASCAWATGAWLCRASLLFAAASGCSRALTTASNPELRMISSSFTSHAVHSQALCEQQCRQAASVGWRATSGIAALLHHCCITLSTPIESMQALIRHALPEGVEAFGGQFPRFDSNRCRHLHTTATR